ncbi:MAG: SDR family NAD(P)-dependent oxidoreductase [Pirellulales bacterium]
MTEFSRQIVLVTGASSGLGLHLTRAWFEAGATVVMVARDAEKLEAARTIVAGDVTEAPTRLLLESCDLTDRAAVERLLRNVAERCGRLDVLVNCAGVSARGTIADTPIAEFDRLWRLNVVGLLNAVQCALPLLHASRGVVVNIGSLAGKTAPRFVGPYAATKHAVAAISQQLRLETAADGVHVLHVCPGPIRRDDAGTRYDAQTTGLPAGAAKPGAGAKIKGLDPAELSKKILRAVAQRQLELIVPAKVRVLLILSAISARWGDWLLSRSTGG